MQSIKVALVYDRVNSWGGAERVLLALHSMFPHAPLYTSVYNSKKALWAKKFTIYTSFLQKMPFAKSHHQLFAPLMPFAFASFHLKKYDIVISVTSESAKGIRVARGVPHICICLTPTRYLWSGYEEYFSNKIVRKLLYPFIAMLRMWDKQMAARPTQFIAISEEVKKRIATYYNRDALVLYPPLMLDTKKKKSAKEIILDKDYFLVIARLSKFTLYKRVDLAIKAATRLALPLVVIGSGNQKYFQKFAGPTVKFISSVSDEALAQYYKNAKALIFPGYEDFGLVMAEAQSYGLPVIAYKKGGALEIVKDGITGTFFKKQTVSSLSRVLRSFQGSLYNKQSIIKNAKAFSYAQFEKSLRKYILELANL